MLRAIMLCGVLAAGLTACDQRARNEAAEAGRQVGEAAKEAGRSVVEATGKVAGRVESEAKEAANNLRRRADEAKRENQPPATAPQQPPSGQ